jgi:nucleotide-binding universal stress UspA family protein
VVVGVNGGKESRAALAFAFAEADRLGTGVRVVRCTPRRYWARDTEGVRRLIDELSVRHPDVPVQSEELLGSPVRALVWHAGFGSVLVLGSHGSRIRSVARAVLRRASCPVVVIGPHAALD